jgi:hypothetical protein
MAEQAQIYRSTPKTTQSVALSGAIQPERTGTPFRFKDFLENGVPVHFGKIQTELTIL